MNTKTHYDKMAESSTHFTLHETMTTNQSRAVTDDSLQQKQMSSRPSGSASAAGTFSQIPAGSRSRDGERENPHPTSRSQHYPASAPQHQYLVNENYDKSEGYNTTARSQKSSKLSIQIIGLPIPSISKTEKTFSLRLSRAWLFKEKKRKVFTNSKELESF